MPLTKIKRGGLDTGITDNSDANALTFDSSENATFVGNITSNTGKFYAPADVNLIGYSRNTKVIEYDANHTINMSYAANVAGDLTVQNTSGAGNLTLHGDPATLLVDGVGSAYSVIAKGAGGNWGALSFCVGTNDNSASTWWIGLDDDSGDDLHFANYQFGTSYLTLDKSAGATFAGAITSSGNISSTAGNIDIAPTKKIFLDGGGDTYIQEDSANNILFQSSTSTFAGTITQSGDYLTINHSSQNGIKIYGNDTACLYIYDIDDSNSLSGGLTFSHDTAEFLVYTNGVSSNSEALKIASDNTATFAGVTTKLKNANAQLWVGEGDGASDIYMSKGDTGDEVRFSKNMAGNLDILTNSGNIHLNESGYSFIKATAVGVSDGSARTLILGGRPNDTNSVTLGFDSNKTYRGSFDFTANTGKFAYWVYDSSWIEVLALNKDKSATFAGNILGYGRLQAAVSLDANFAHELFNSHATGHGLKVRGGSTSSQYALYVSDHNQTNSLFYVMGDGKTTIDSDSATGLTVDVGLPSAANREIARFQAQSARPIAVGWIDSGSKMSLYTPSSHHLVFGVGALGTNHMELQSDGQLDLSGALKVIGKSASVAASGFSQWDWVTLGYIGGSAGNGAKFRFYWDGLTVGSCCHHGFAEVEAWATYNGNYNYGYDSHVRLNNMAKHNSFGINGIRMIRGTNGLYVQVKITGDPSGGTFYSYLLERYATAAVETPTTSVPSAGTVTEEISFEAHSQEANRGWYQKHDGEIGMNYGLGIKRTPDYPLDVTQANGVGARFDRSGSSGEVIIITDDSTTCAEIRTDQTYNYTSDYRLKENVKDLKIDGLARVNALKPKSFNLKKHPDIPKEGFIAHEVQEVIPLAVSYEKDGTEKETYVIREKEYDMQEDVEIPAEYGEREVPKYQMMSDSAIIPTLVKAIQELSDKVEALENK